MLLTCWNCFLYNTCSLQLIWNLTTCAPASSSNSLHSYFVCVPWGTWSHSHGPSDYGCMFISKLSNTVLYCFTRSVILWADEVCREDWHISAKHSVLSTDFHLWYTISFLIKEGLYIFNLKCTALRYDNAGSLISKLLTISSVNLVIIRSRVWPWSWVTPRTCYLRPKEDIRSRKVLAYWSHTSSTCRLKSPNISNSPDAEDFTTLMEELSSYSSRGGGLRAP